MKRLDLLLIWCDIKALSLILIAPFVSLAFTMSPLPPSQWLDTEVVTNLPVRIGDPGRDWYFDFQMSCAAASNSVQMAFGEDEDANGSLSPEETQLVVGRDATRVFIEDTTADERFEEELAVSGSRVGFGARVSLRHAGKPSRFIATNEAGRVLFTDWRTNPPAMLFDPSWNLVRVTVRGPTTAEENVFVAIGPVGHVLIFR